MSAWTQQDARAAQLECWMLIHDERGGYVIVDLLDEAEDGSALEWVKLFGGMGLQPHAKALQIVRARAA